MFNTLSLADPLSLVDGGGQRQPCHPPKETKAAPKIKWKKKEINCCRLDWKIKRLLTTASWGTLLWNLVLKMLILHQRASRIKTKNQGPLIEQIRLISTGHGIGDWKLMKHFCSSNSNTCMTLSCGVLFSVTELIYMYMYVKQALQFHVLLIVTICPFKCLTFILEKCHEVHYTCYKIHNPNSPKSSNLNTILHTP